MKVQPSYLFMAAGLLIGSQGAPFVSGYGWRLLAGAAVVTACAIVFLIDKWTLQYALPGQARRIMQSNYAALAALLYPIASRCAPGTWANLILDAAVYCGAIIFFACATASRLESVSIHRSIPVSRAVRWSFPSVLILYFFLVGVQLASSYGSYRIEWVDFSFEFAPVWQTVRYGLFRLINEFSRETTSLVGHWPLIYALLSPLTMVWKSPVAVLWASTFFIAASAYPVYLLAKQHTKSAPVSACIGTLYLLYLPVHLANLYDFHSDPLALPFLFLSFLFAARKQWVLFGCMMAAALSCKEYVGLVYAGYGLWMLGTNKKAGAIISAAGFAWFLCAVKSGLWSNQADVSAVVSANYGALGGGHGMAGLAGYCLTHPGEVLSRLLRQNNIVALMSLFLPFLFLPLKKPWVLAGGLFILIKNALSESGIELLSHRESLFFPFVIYAFILAVADMPASKRRYMLPAISFAVAATFMLQGHAFPSRGFWHLRSEYVKSAHDKVCDTILGKIPREAPVMASSHLASHVLERKWYFLFPRFPTPVSPDYIAVDTLEQQGWNWLTRKEHQEGFLRIKQSKDYRVAEEKDGVFLFTRLK
jgi:uncharacterized membrane protein